MIFISHAHMDHIPNLPSTLLHEFKNKNLKIKFLCSKITKGISEARTKGKFLIPESSWMLGKDSFYPQSIQFKNVRLTLIENGHCYGSTSLLIEGSERILYTSDFITEDREFPNELGIIKGLKPLKCDHLIIECTYGLPHYIFPSFQALQTELNEYIDKSLSEGHPVICLGYDFGKSQEILKMIQYPCKIILDRQISDYIKILQNYGIKFPDWKPYNNYKKTQLSNIKDYTLLIPPYSMFKESYNHLITNGAKTIFFSGKGLDKSTQDLLPVDKCLLLSDHSDFPNLCSFIKKCEPKSIYLEHGKLEPFSYYLSKYLGFHKIFINGP